MPPANSQQSPPTLLDRQDAITSISGVTGTQASPQTLYTGATLAFDGSVRVKIEFGCSSVLMNGQANYVVEVWRDGTSLVGRIVDGAVPASGANSVIAVYGVIWDTPPAGEHSYVIKVWKSGGTFNIGQNQQPWYKLWVD